MVTRGQLLERPVVIPAGEICLDGIYLRGEAPGLVIASPLPHQGGSMVNTVGCELAYAAAYAGCASLRIDYRGVGASEGEASEDVALAAADLREGIEFLIETTHAETVALASYLSGSWAALRAARDDPRVDRLLLVAPEWRDVPEGVPAYGEAACPVRVVVPGDEPTLDMGAELTRVEAARNTKLTSIPGATRSFRERLARLARVVPPLLGRDLPE